MGKHATCTLRGKTYNLCLVGENIHLWYTRENIHPVASVWKHFLYQARKNACKRCVGCAMNRLVWVTSKLIGQNAYEPAHMLFILTRSVLYHVEWKLSLLLFLLVVLMVVVLFFCLFNASLFVYLCRSDGRVALHPSSVNSDEKQFISQWLVYHDKVIRTDSFNEHRRTYF